MQQGTTGPQSPAIYAESGATVTVNYGGISKQTLAVLMKQLSGNEKVINRFVRELDEKDVAIQKRDEAIQELVKKYKELEARLTARPAEDILVKEAKKRLDEDDFEGAEKLLKESLEKNLKAIAERKKSAAADAYELGSIKELKLEYEEAKKYFEQAVELDIQNGDYLNRYGLLLDNLAEHKKAIDYFEKALTIDLAVYGDKHPNVAIDYNNLGVAWRQLGDAKKAIDYFEKALTIDLVVYGDKHPDVAIRYNNLGDAWRQLGDAKKAIDYFEKALTIDLAVYGDKHPDVAIMYNNLGGAWRQLGDAKKAIDYFEKVLMILSELYGKDNSHTKTVQTNLDSLRIGIAKD